MDPLLELIDSIYIEKVLRARQGTIEQKLLSGPVLFASACEMTRAGIRAQNPGASPEQVKELLKARLTVARRLEEADLERS